MDFNEHQLQINVIDARRNQRAEGEILTLLQFFSRPQDNIVYAPEGIAACIVSLTEYSRSTCFRVLRDLEDQGFLYSIDEFSLQLNPQFFTKTQKRIKYLGKPLIYDQDELNFLKQLHQLREQSWARDGQ